MQYLQSLYDHPHPHFDNPPLDQTTTDDVHATGLEVFIKMAEVCTYQANYQKALEMLDQVLVVHSSHEIALTFKGFINCILGQRDESFTYFNRVLFHNPLNYSAFAHRGYLFIMEDSFKAAKQDLERSLQICKENAYANAYLGELAYREQRTFKALEHFNLSLCQETSYIGLVGRGKCFLKLNLVKNAAYDFETAVDLFPNFQEAESYLELIKNQIGSTTIKQCLALKKEAIDLELRKILTNMDKKALSCTKMGQKVLEIEAKLKTDEFRENLWLEKGFLELLLEKYDHALEDLNKALVLNPFNDQAYAHRGRIFYLYNLKLAAQNGRLICF